MKLTDDDAKALLIAAVAVPSPSGHEDAVAHLLAERMASFGFTSHVDAVGNVIGECGDPDGPVIVLLGHIDTVSTLLPTVDTGESLIGRGSVDAKGPLCCFICAAAAPADAPVRLVVIGVVEEETTSRGARFVADRFAPDLVFIGEPSGADAMVIGYKGRIGGSYARFEPSGHIAGPQENAVMDAMRFWGSIEDYCRAWPPTEMLFDRPEPSVSRLAGDASIAEIRFDIRIPENFDINAFLVYAADHAGKGTLRIEETTEAARFSRNCPQARALSASLRAADFTPKIKVKTGTCDMNVLHPLWTAPMIAYGPGDSKLDHTSNEHIYFREYFLAIDLLSDALWRLCEELTSRPVAREKLRANP